MLGSGPSEGVNVAVGTGGSAAAVSSHKALYGKETYEDFRSKSKNMVFNMKKLLNVGVDLTLWRRGHKKRFGQNERQILRILARMTGFRRRTAQADVYQQLFRQHAYPKVQRTHPDGKYAFRQFRHWPRGCSQNSLFPADRLPYSPDLNSPDFSISCALQAKVQVMPHSNLAALRPSVAAE
jgi:hypothetical protein